MSLSNPGLHGLRILVGITGSIAAYKVAEWVRYLVKEEAIVTVMMTDASQQFISPLTFSALSGNRVFLDMFEDDAEGVMAHINLSKEHDMILVAPATAQTISKLAHGAADNLVSTTILAAKIPIVICPAMNTNMYSHLATQNNLDRLKQYGYHIVSPDCGEMACGDTGEGRLPEWETAREKLLSVFAPDDLSTKKIVITAGPTREPIDPARYISNRSSGKMGFALAKTANRRGGEVTLISGPVSLPDPPGVKVIRVQTAAEMDIAVQENISNADIIIKAAAVADYRPKNEYQQKIKKKADVLTLDLIKNKDILANLGKQKKKGRVLVGFAAESQNHKEEGYRKLTEKNADLIVVNDILGSNTGFDVETNQVTLISQNSIEEIPLLSKEGTANKILEKAVSLLS